MTAGERAALARAKARLDTLDCSRGPCACGARADRRRVPWLFRLPWFRRFDGYTMWNLILLRRAAGASRRTTSSCHELCHVWQMQHHPLRMPLSYLVAGYRNNPYELEARRAASVTAASGPQPPARS